MLENHRNFTSIASNPLLKTSIDLTLALSTTLLKSQLGFATEADGYVLFSQSSRLYIKKVQSDLLFLQDSNSHQADLPVSLLWTERYPHPHFICWGPGPSVWGRPGLAEALRAGPSMGSVILGDTVACHSPCRTPGELMCAQREGSPASQEPVCRSCSPIPSFQNYERTSFSY